jgi:hypothetical protein
LCPLERSSHTHFLGNARTPYQTVFSWTARVLFLARIARVWMLELFFQPRDQRIKTRWVLVQASHLEGPLEHQLAVSTQGQFGHNLSLPENVLGSSTVFPSLKSIIFKTKTRVSRTPHSRLGFESSVQRPASFGSTSTAALIAFSTGVGYTPNITIPIMAMDNAVNAIGFNSSGRGSLGSAKVAWTITRK